MNATVSRATVQLLVVLCWVAMIPSFLYGRFRSGRQVRHRDYVSWLGIGIQGVAFTFSWMGPWWALMPARRQRPDVSWPIVGIAVALGLAGAVLVIAAVHTLGRQWSLTARVLEGHRLITTGPYRIVRNPIYTGMWALQLATALAFSTGWLGWPLLPISAAIYYLGTLLRVRREERLLRAEFGPAFDDYARCVPALIPFPVRRRRSLRQSAG